MAFSNNLFRIYCIVFLYALSTKTEWTIEDEKCNFLDGYEGLCVPFNSCKPIFRQLKNNFSMFSAPDAIVHFLRAYHCGFDNKTLKVCCSEPFLESVIDKQYTGEPPDVSKHTNLHLLPKECGYMSLDHKIINGKETGLYEFPWMALLKFSDDSLCAGTIINEKYILTAAHCLNKIETLIGVHVGDYNLGSAIDCEFTVNGEKNCAPPFQDLSIEEIIPHPYFNVGAHNLNDIALLRVSKMNLSLENVKPICLPLGSARNFNSTNRKFLVTGWGKTNTGQTSQTLQKVFVSEVSHEKCVQDFKNINKVLVTRYQMCAGGKESDSCSGDSGGPLQVSTKLYGDSRMVQQGIVSYGPAHCASNLPGIYTKVAYYMDWILDNIKL